MSKQLTISATASVCAMALFALTHALGGNDAPTPSAGFAHTKGAANVIAAPLAILQP